MLSNILKPYKDIIISTIVFSVLVLLFSFVLDGYLTFLRTAPTSILETIVYWLSSPFNEAHESILLNFYLFLPVFVIVGIYYSIRIPKIIKFWEVFVLSVLSTWILYIKELLINGINNGAGTSIIGISLFSVSAIALFIDLPIFGYKHKRKLLRLFNRLSSSQRIFYSVFLILLLYSFVYWITYFQTTWSSIQMHLDGLGFFVLLFMAYIGIKYKKRLHLHKTKLISMK